MKRYSSDPQAVVNSKHRFPAMTAAFQPHVRILFLRHPAHALSALRRRDYAKKTGTGTVEMKLRLIEEAFMNQDELGFDSNITYEELAGVAKAPGYADGLAGVAKWKDTGGVSLYDIYAFEHKRITCAMYFAKFCGRRHMASRLLQRAVLATAVVVHLRSS